MEQLRKVVAVGCLTYVLYGLISWFQLGVFLPPLPIKPFIFLGFAIFGLVSAARSGLKALDVSFYLWLVLISVTNQSFLELFVSTPQIITFQDNVEVFFQLIAVVLFIVFNVLIIFSLRKVKLSFAIYFLILTALVILIFTMPSYVSLKESIIIMAIIYFLSNRFISTTLNNSVERTVILLTGIALIEAIELIALSQ
jgi:hypothetical protein